MKKFLTKIKNLDTGVKVVFLIGGLVLLGLMMMAGVSEITPNE
jgi:hypothetical protein